MTIISISILEELLTKLDKFEKESDYSGRSDVIRAALQSFLAEQQTQSEMKGTVEGVLILIHKDSASGSVLDLRHEYENVVKTQLHHHLDEDKCLELLVVKGNAEHVKNLVKDFQKRRNIKLVRFILS